MFSLGENSDERMEISWHSARYFKPEKDPAFMK